MKLTKKLLAVVLCFTLCLSLGVTAFAANGGDGETTDKTADGATAGFMKTLTIDNDLISAFQAADPNQTFTFSFAPGTADPDNAVFAPNAFTQSFTAADMAVGENLLSKGYTINQLFDISDENAATDALVAKGIVRAGVWVYKVTETTADSTTEVDVGGSTPGTLTKTLKKGNEEFTLRIYVVNGGDGLKIKFVTVWNGDEKVDPTLKPVVDPVSGETTSTTESEFLFTGSYREDFEADDDPPGPPGPGSKDYGAFTVTKKISGDTREFADLTKPFKIKIKVIPASNLTQAELDAGFTYTIYTEKTAVAAASLSAEQTGAYNTEITVNLSDGDVFRIKKLPVGCEFTVTEPDYSSTWAADHYKNESVVYDSALTTALAEAGGVHGPVTNAFDVNTIPPTGIVVNNLPFVLVVVLALGGIVLFFVTNRRRREEEN